MTDFAEGSHSISGDADSAHEWIESSSLPGDDKAGLHRFVDRFCSLTFTKEDDAALNRYEETDDVVLPEWFRAVRMTLAFTVPGTRVQVKGFRWDRSPRAEEQEGHWYEIEPGYVDEENRETMFDLARLYPIGQWFADDRSYLAVDLENPGDRRIVEFALEDLWDDEAKGELLRESTYPVYSSYADLLDHVVAVRLPDGTVVEATG